MKYISLPNKNGNHIFLNIKYLKSITFRGKCVWVKDSNDEEYFDESNFSDDFDHLKRFFDFLENTETHFYISC